MIYVICCIIICCTTYIGFGISSYYIKRERLFNELCRFCGNLKSDIGFLLMPLEEIFHKASGDYASALRNIVEVCREIISKGSALECESLCRIIHCPIISNEEKRLICEFLSVLGKSDEKNQIESIEAYRARFYAAESSCADEKKRFSPMYRKLGFLFGIAICVFLV